VWLCVSDLRLSIVHVASYRRAARQHGVAGWRHRASYGTGAEDRMGRGATCAPPRPQFQGRMIELMGRMCGEMNAWRHVKVGGLETWNGAAGFILSVNPCRLIAVEMAS
jgi:hypothetical protein